MNYFLRDDCSVSRGGTHCNGCTHLGARLYSRVRRYMSGSWLYVFFSSFSLISHDVHSTPL